MALNQTQIDAVKLQLSYYAINGIVYSEDVDADPTSEELTLMIDDCPEAPDNMMLCFPTINRMYVRSAVKFTPEPREDTWHYWDMYHVPPAELQP